MGCQITGTGSYLPENCISNEDLVRLGVDTTDAWIAGKTGIQFRYWALPDLSLLSVALGSEGDLHDRIIVPMGGSRRPATAEGIAKGETSLKMDGPTVWDYATRCVPRAVRQVVARAGLTISDIDWFVPHQANKRMIEAIAAELGIRPSRVLVNVQKVANTAAASVPIALDRAALDGQLRPGHTMALVGFGAGMAWSALCLRWGASGRDGVEA
jgi:3-oxoacyl-[acyl-carrier-protein] synthase-3